MEIDVRFAEKKDIHKILEIVNHEILNSTAIYDYKVRTYDEQLKWLENKHNNNLPVLVAINKQDNVLGFATYGIFRPWEAYKFSIEHSIYIDSKFRNIGIGKLLLNEVISLAKKDGFHTLIAGIDASNDISIKFHKKFGFKEIGTFKDVGFKFDKWLDLIFLQLII